mmetsp:Transcript_18281/g.49397  ORF Transcript_18281/g.49397 Transcript_18281/m.49397 type:complete len:216 (-) Transcript_18281:146-793(-)
MRLVDDHLCRRLPPRSDARLHLNSSTFDRNNARTSLERIVKNEDAAQHGSTLERILHARADPAHYEIAQRLVARDKEHRRLWLSQQPLKHQVHGNERLSCASRSLKVQIQHPLLQALLELLVLVRGQLVERENARLVALRKLPAVDDDLEELLPLEWRIAKSSIELSGQSEVTQLMQESHTAYKQPHPEHWTSILTPLLFLIQRRDAALSVLCWK